MALVVHACSVFWAGVQRAMFMRQDRSIVVRTLAACAAHPAAELTTTPLATPGVRYVLIFDGSSRG
jgi:hypothetical protein